MGKEELMPKPSTVRTDPQNVLYVITVYRTPTGEHRAAVKEKRWTRDLSAHRTPAEAVREAADWIEREETAPEKPEE
jgi:hypothetical protein